MIHQESSEEPRTGDDRGGPHDRGAPLGRDRPKILGKRRRNQERDEKLTVVKTDGDASGSPDLDLCHHG